MNDTLSPNPTALPSSGGLSVPQGLDPKAYTLTRAIALQEGGGRVLSPDAKGASGETGIYQYIPATWQNYAQQVLGDANAPMTDANQNRVAYTKIKSWLDAGATPAQAASMWNAGEGAPNAYLGNKGVNGSGVSYDTKAYVDNVQKYAEQLWGQAPQPTEQPIAQTTQAPSVKGFAENVVKSGANLLGNVGDAILHPIQTIQNIGGAAVGGLQELGGQQNENTAKFDSVISYFTHRYGGVSNLEKTLYEDPVGFAADLSAVLTAGAGAAGLASKGASIAGATKTAESLSQAAGAVSRAADLTNPLAPVAAGISKTIAPIKEASITAIGKTAGLEPSTIDVARAGALSPETIANTTREAVGAEVIKALDSRLGELGKSSKAYEPVLSSVESIPVSRNWLETQFRSIGLKVEDGILSATPTSAIRSSAEVNKLQSIFDLYKPSFQKGSITPKEFKNLRDDLGSVAYNDLGKKSTDVARETDKIRAKLNTDYRKNIPGLEQLDMQFSSQTKEYTALKKGLFDKNGKPTDSLTKLVANAGNKGNETRLARLEQLVPGITKKLQLLRAVEDFTSASGTKVGTYGRSILEAGGLIGGLVTGQVEVVAAGFAAAIIAEPARAVKILSALDKVDPALAKAVALRISKYLSLSGVVAKSIETVPQETPSPTPSTGLETSSQEQVASQA